MTYFFMNVSAILVDHLKKAFAQEPSVAVVYMYCEYQQQHLQTPTNLIASIWRQLSQHTLALPEEIQSMYRNHERQQMGLGMEDIMSITVSAMQDYSRILIVVDALDECTEENRTRARFIQSLQAFLSEVPSTKGKVQVAITSRLKATPFKQAQVVGIQATKGDLKKFIRKSISDGVSSSQTVTHKVQTAKDLQKTITDAIVRSARKM